MFFLCILSTEVSCTCTRTYSSKNAPALKITAVVQSRPLIKSQHVILWEDMDYDIRRTITRRN